MRILILSDIHANLVALETVLDAAKGQWDQLWCLGDVVGYGPDPNECVDVIREQAAICLTGNHDWAVLGRMDLQQFNPEARHAIEWAQAALTVASRDFLEPLPPLRSEGAFTLAHASPRHPVWEYILEGEVAAQNYAYFTTPYCLVGHTHVPALYEQAGVNHVVVHDVYDDVTVALGERRLIVNPGSVGQPRDGDPRAAFALLDLEALTWTWHRVPYDIRETQVKMRQEGLPLRLIHRLSFGW